MKMKMQSRAERDLEGFLRGIAKLGPAEVCGVARMLKVEIIDMKKVKEEIEKVKQVRGKRAQSVIIDEPISEEAKVDLDKDSTAKEVPMRPMDMVLDEMITNFLALSKHARKEMIRIIKDCPRGL